MAQRSKRNRRAIAYLSVKQWPRDWDLLQRQAVLTAAAVVDLGFSSFRPPAGVILRIARAPLGTADHPRHEFYVRWVAALSGLGQ